MLANFKDRMDVAFQQMDRTLPAVNHTDQDGDPAIRILIVNGHELMNPHEILVHSIATQFITLDPLETSTLSQKICLKKMLIWQRNHLKRHLKSSHSKNQPIHEINTPSPSDVTSAPPPFRQNGSLPAAAPPPRRCGRRHSRCPEVAGRGGRCDTRRPNAPVTGSTLPSPW